MFSFVGGTNVVHHVHFSEAVRNPYLAIVSLGSSSVGASFAFSNVGSITLISEGDGYYGDGELSISGGTVTGLEGHGVVRLNGSFTDLYFTTPQDEYWYGASIGIPVVAVPEPGTWCMLAAGGAMLGMLGRRRKDGKQEQST
ncbi:PEP-CTERM sorting domain-containing protein [Pseudoduganella albidiflava]|nr:PEP-CTERM sorting domain-containing protein [Pseudoduganella albidiflava]